MPDIELLALAIGSTDADWPSPLVPVTESQVTALGLPHKRRAILLPKSRKVALKEASSRQALLEAAMTKGTLIPISPNTVLHRNQIGPFIRANRPIIDTLSERLANKVQFQVMVSWTAEKVLTRFRAEPELRRHFEAGVVQAQTLQEDVHKLRARLANDMESELSSIAVEMITLPCAEDMLINTVLMIDISEEHKLDQVIEKIDEIWSEGLRIRQIGPAPAASFARLDLQLITRDDIIAAHAELGFETSTTPNNLEDACRNALRRRPQDAVQIRHAASVLEADARNRSTGPFHFCRVQSEDRSTATSRPRKVA